jgi:hypothetical protein
MAYLGTLIHTIVFSNPLKVRTETGGTVSTYTPFLTTKGSYERKKSVKLNEMQEMVFSNTFIIHCHFQTELVDNITVSTIVEVAGKKHKILGYEMLEDKRFFYQFLVTSE